MDASSSISVFILLDFNQFKYVGNFLLLYLIFLRNYSTSLIAYRIGDSYNCMILFFSLDIFFFFQLEDLQRLCLVVGPQVTLRMWLPMALKSLQVQKVMLEKQLGKFSVLIHL